MGQGIEHLCRHEDRQICPRQSCQVTQDVNPSVTGTFNLELRGKFISFISIYDCIILIALHSSHKFRILMLYLGHDIGAIIISQISSDIVIAAVNTMYVLYIPCTTRNICYTSQIIFLFCFRIYLSFSVNMKFRICYNHEVPFQLCIL